MLKKGKSKAGLLIIAIVIIVGLLYVQNLKNYGVMVSCENSSIIGYGKTTPYLMSVVQPAYCDVNYTVKFNGATVCEGKRSLLRATGVIACTGIEQYDGKDLLITAEFYPAGSQILAKSDLKLLTFQKNKIG